ncbi:putative sulfate exporter family transporter [Porticoccaceae bacterium]|nr:putative sulfate exporter family transporter [Porticoccaceae bacterium]
MMAVNLRATLSRYQQGVIAALIVAMAALFLSVTYHAPVMLFALLLGMSANFLYDQERCQAGIDFCAASLLRLGVALLGVNIFLEDVQSIGWQSLLLVIGSLFATILFGGVLSRWLGLDRRLGFLSGGAVAICGISAALTLSSVMRKDRELEKFTTLVVGLVATFGAIAMVAYPVLVSWLQLSTEAAGVFLGGAIHDVSHVVGAGFAISEPVGVAAMTVKMVRVAMLVPVAWLFLWLFNRAAAPAELGESVNTARVPVFLWAFVGLALLNNLIAIPAPISETLSTVSRYCFVLAIVALGIKTSFRSLLDIGWRPIVLVLAESLFIGALVLMWVLF